ncbi:hypothetical protein, partial [Endozoicomonas sp. ONNA2]|uniref:hypothetical protein n=1 Tax=Endozoicomonas sp. ONNA2 TaxID=2828741 RepID=UPI0021475417
MQYFNTPSSSPVKFWNKVPDDQEVLKPSPIKPETNQNSTGLKVTKHPPSKCILPGNNSAFSPTPKTTEKVIKAFKQPNLIKNSVKPSTSGAGKDNDQPGCRATGMPGHRNAGPPECR